MDILNISAWTGFCQRKPDETAPTQLKITLPPAMKSKTTPFLFRFYLNLPKNPLFSGFYFLFPSKIPRFLPNSCLYTLFISPLDDQEALQRVL